MPLCVLISATRYLVLRRDLVSLNIMRGRDSCLPDYNTVRKYYHLPRHSNWSEINPGLYREDRELFDKLEEVYGDPSLSYVDLYIGGMLESSNAPGPLYRRIIKDQFERTEMQINSGLRIVIMTSFFQKRLRR